MDPVTGQLGVVFHHELKDELRGFVFCSGWDDRGRNNAEGLDISGLAKAAVAGDEEALDMFSVWQSNPSGKVSRR